MKGTVNHFFILSNRQPIKTKNQLKISFISPCGDKLSRKFTYVDVHLLKCRQIVWENHSSGTSSPDKETTYLGKSIKWNKFADKEIACLRKQNQANQLSSKFPLVIYSRMSIISIKGTEKYFGYKLHSLLVKCF